MLTFVDIEEEISMARERDSENSLSEEAKANEEKSQDRASGD